MAVAFAMMMMTPNLIRMLVSLEQPLFPWMKVKAAGKHRGSIGGHDSFPKVLVEFHTGSASLGSTHPQKSSDSSMQVICCLGSRSAATCPSVCIIMIKM